MLLLAEDITPQVKTKFIRVLLIELNRTIGLYDP